MSQLAGEVSSQGNPLLRESYLCVVVEFSTAFALVHWYTTVGTSTRAVACASASKPQPLLLLRGHPPALSPARSKITENPQLLMSKETKKSTAALKCTIHTCMAQHLHRLVEAAHTIGAVAVVVQRPK